MKILPAQSGVKKAIQHVKDGGVLIYPTESSYGIGCKASDVVAVGNLFALKERPINKTVLILVSSIEQAKQLIQWSDTTDKLAQEHWPGPLSVVAPATDEGLHLAPGVVASDGTIALRISPHPVALALTKAVGPLVSSSANRSEESPCYDLNKILDWLGSDDSVLALDAGPLTKNAPSTVVRVDGDHTVVLRDGRIKLPEVIR